MNPKLRLAFMGSPEFAVPVLDALVEAGHDIRCVYSQPPRPAGRGKKLRATPVQARAEALGLEVRTPESLRTDAAQHAFAALDLDAAIVVAYGLILPKAILEAPRLGCMNMHASLLPRWRGAAPIHRAIMAGDQITGVQAMIMEEGLDTGPVLASETTRIFPFDTTGSLHDRLADLAADLAVLSLEGWADGSLTPQAQSERGIVYAHKVDAGDRRIDWSRPADMVDCQIRGLSPFPGAWFQLEPGRTADPIRIRALDSRLAEDCEHCDAQPGTVIDTPLVVVCGDGRCVRLLELQKPGSRPMSAEETLRGLPIPPGTRLS